MARHLLPAQPDVDIVEEAGYDLRKSGNSRVATLIPCAKKQKGDRMLRVLTGVVMAASLMANPVLAQGTTSTVLSGEAFGFEVLDSTTPDPFFFIARSNIEPNEIDVVSNIITISGITEPVTASVSDLGTGGSPKISVNGALYTTAPVTVFDGDSLRVAVLPDAGVFSATYRAEVAIGGGTAVFQVMTRAADTAPDAFSFLAATNQEPGQVIPSSFATISGLEAPASVTVAGAVGSPQISVDGGATWGTSATVTESDTLAVRLTSGTFGETRTATVNVGGVTADFSVTTRSSNENPVFSAFEPATGVEPSVTVTSAPVTVSGIETTVTAAVSGDGLPEIQVNDGAWVAVGGTASVANNDTVRVRMSSGAFGETRVAILDINGTTGDFSATTRAADTVPDGFTIAAVTGAPASSVTQSLTTITGIEAAAVVTISGEGSPIFSTDEGVTWIDGNGSGSVVNGGTVLVRLTSGSFDQTRTATLTVGGGTGDFTVTTEGQDTTPDTFTFASALGVGESVRASQIVTLTGFTGSVTISVSGDGSPEYQIGSADWTSTDGAVTAGQEVRVRLTASATERATRTATLTVGTRPGTFTVETQDRTPSGLSLAAVTGADLNTMTPSNPVTISGITGSVPVSIENAFEAEYRINGGAWVSTAGSVVVTDTVSVRFRSSNAYASERSVSLTVGTATETFLVTTRGQDTTPDAFTFTARLISPGTADVASGSVILSGFDGSVPVLISGDASAEYRIGTDVGGTITFGDWTSEEGTISASQQAQVRLDAATGEGVTRTATLSVGAGSALYEVTTQDLTPDAFAFSGITGAALSSPATSSAVQISGITGEVSVNVSEGNGALYRVGTGPDAASITWTGAGFLDYTSARSVSEGQWVQVRLTSSASYDTPVIASLTIGSSSEIFSVTTGSEPVSVTISSGTVPDGEEGVSYDGFDFTTVASVSGGSVSSPPTVNDLTWSVTSGALPVGMSLSASGDLTGTPSQIGSFGFTVQAALGAQTASASYTIIVNDPVGSFVIEGG